MMYPNLNQSICVASTRPHVGLKMLGLYFKCPSLSPDVTYVYGTDIIRYCFIVVEKNLRNLLGLLTDYK